MSKLTPDISEAVIEAVRNTAREQCSSPHDVEFSFLSGSVVEGLATPKSDYDVYVVLNSSSSIDEKEIFASSSVGLVEVTFINASTFSDISEKIELGYHKSGGLSSYQLSLAHRLITGVALDNVEVLDTYRERLSREKLSFYLCEYSRKFADKCYSDAIGNLEANDEDSAIFNADRAIHLSLDTLLAGLGNTSSLIKWRSRYAKKILGENHPALTRYMDLVSSLPGHSKQRKREFVSYAGRYLQAAWDFTHALYSFPGASFELTDSRFCGPDPMSNGVAVLSKAPWARVVTYDGKFVLCGHSPLYEISMGALAVWLAVDNSVCEQRLIETLSQQEWGAVSADEVKISLNNFKAIGVIR